MNQNQDPWNPQPAGGFAGDAFGAPPPGPPPFTPGLRDGPSWEHWREIGFFRAWFATIAEVLTRPDQTFQGMRREGGLAQPVGFCVLTLWVTQLLGFLIMLPIRVVMEAMHISSPLSAQPQLPPWLTGGFGLFVEIIFIVLLGPILIVIGLFISSAITHVLLMLFGGARKGFETTLRTLAYTNGACGVLGMIPLCCGGPILMLVAQIAINSIGLSRTHETDTWRAVLAMVLPVLLMFICCCGGILLVGFGLAGSSEFQELLQQFGGPR